MYSSDAPRPHTFQYKDGGASIYYWLSVGDVPQPETVVFIYGATGCPSWKSVMPAYLGGLSVDAHVFIINKRFVTDRSTGLFDCGRDFHLANNPAQWNKDFSEFILTLLHGSTAKYKNVVLVGVSEGAWPATKVAGLLPQITHLAIIGSGGESMRKSLATLRHKGATSFDVESGWKEISKDPRSIEKEWYGNPYRWWSDVMDMDPLPDFLKLNIPVILGIGENDESVPVESARFLEMKFKEAGKENLTLLVYPESDHRLNANGLSHRKAFFGELSRLLQKTQHP